MEARECHPLPPTTHTPFCGDGRDSLDFQADFLLFVASWWQSPLHSSGIPPKALDALRGFCSGRLWTLTQALRQAWEQLQSHIPACLNICTISCPICGLWHLSGFAASHLCPGCIKPWLFFDAIPWCPHYWSTHSSCPDHLASSLSSGLSPNGSLPNDMAVLIWRSQQSMQFHSILPPFIDVGVRALFCDFLSYTLFGVLPWESTSFISLCVGSTTQAVVHGFGCLPLGHFSSPSSWATGCFSPITSSHPGCYTELKKKDHKARSLNREGQSVWTKKNCWKCPTTAIFWGLFLFHNEHTSPIFQLDMIHLMKLHVIKLYWIIQEEYTLRSLKIHILFQNLQMLWGIK